MKTPPITVIALCFNHARFLHDCLDSIAAQTFQDFQLVVTDDASLDASPELISKWLSKFRPNSTFIAHQTNRGICSTLNEALSVATGDYVCMIATDDRWRPDRLAKHLQHLQDAASSIAVVYSDANYIDESGNDLATSFIATHRPGFAIPPTDMFSALADGNFIPAPAATIRRSAIQQVGGYDEALTYEDYDMWLRLAANGGTFSYCGGIVADYRVVPTSMTNTLFIRPSAAHSRSILRLHARWYATDRLTDVQRARWQEKMSGAAYNLFLLDDKGAAPFLWQSGWRQRNPRYFLLAAMSAFGIKRTFARRLLKKIRFWELQKP